MSDQQSLDDGREEQLSNEPAQVSENKATVAGPAQPKIIGGESGIVAVEFPGDGSGSVAPDFLGGEQAPATTEPTSADPRQQPATPPPFVQQNQPATPPPFVQQDYARLGSPQQGSTQGQPAFPQNVPPFSQQANGRMSGFVGAGYPVRAPFDIKTVVSNPDQRWPLVAAVAGFFILLGSFMPWASLWGYSVNGLEGDGWFTIIVGLAIVALSLCYLFLARLRGMLWVPIATSVLGAVALFIAIADIVNVSSERLDMGAGLVVILIFSIVAIVMAVLHLRELSKRKKMHF